MKKANLVLLLQIIGIIGFVLAAFQIELGWFLGFFFTGAYFLLKDHQKGKKLDVILGIIIILYAFYNLFFLTNLL